MNIPKPCCRTYGLIDAGSTTNASEALDHEAIGNSLSRTTRSVAAPAKFWTNGQTLRIAITRYDEAMFQAVVAAINQWAPHVNLKFEFIELDDNDELYDGDIRILLSHFKDGAGSSVIGTDARDILPHLPTMVLGTDYQSSFFTVAALHEFGHALGVEHEHQHPDAPLDWNLSALYREFKEHGWTEEEIYRNVLKKFDYSHTRQTPYDPKSIMHYAFPASVMWDKIEVPQNNQLSEQDIKFISSVYPR